MKKLIRWTSKSFLIFLLILVISLPARAYSQTCEYVYKDDGSRVERVIKIDGDDYFYFPEHVARRLAKTAVENAALKSENEVLKKSNKTLVANHIFNVEMAEYYRKMSETNFEYMVKRLEHTQKPDPFYKRFSFGFISGFGLAAASYFFWDYARDN